MFACGRFLLYHLALLASETALGMRRTDQILCISFVLNCLLPCTSVHYRPPIWASSPRNHIPGHCRRLQVPCVMRPAGQHSIIQAVGFRCAHCSREFETRHAMDCHRRQQSSQGTECADPSNSKSLSFTGRASFASSRVREHDFLGACLNHMEVVYVHRREDLWTLT